MTKSDALTNQVKGEMTAQELAAKENIIERGKKAFVEVGTALAEIRDRRGYRFEFKTFEEYCRVRWEWDRRNVSYYIGASEVVKQLGTQVPNIEYTQARELSRLYTPSNGNGDKRKKEIDVAAVREVASEIDFSTATVRQVTAKVDEKLRAQRRTARQANAYAPRMTEGNSAIQIYNRDACTLSQFVSPDVDLVFTSPPYNVGKAYTAHNDTMAFEDYRQMLQSVFRECFKVMRPGARIGVNVVAGAGRSRLDGSTTYLPVAAYVMLWLIECDFVPIGEVVWDKGFVTIANKTSYGSHRMATSPCFRDQTERILWARKGNVELSIPDEFFGMDEHGTYTAFLRDRDVFNHLAADLWSVAPESAKHIGHPAPFPVELVEKAIRFFAYPTAHILDPFAGSGSTGVAAKKLNCRATLIDKDAGYCELARERAAQTET